MSSYSYKRLVLLTCVLLFPGTILIAAEAETSSITEVPIETETSAVAQTSNETEAPAETDAITEIPVKIKTPVEISPADDTMACKAPYAYKASNPCEGMAEGDYFGTKVCAECHQDKIENMEAISHGQEVDSRTPFGQMLIRCI